MLHFFFLKNSFEKIELLFLEYVYVQHELFKNEKNILKIQHASFGVQNVFGVFFLKIGV